MSKETFTPWDSAEFLKDEEVVIQYLQAALEENDPELFVKAVGNVARAMGMSAVAQETQLGVQVCTRRCPVSATRASAR